MENLTWKSLAKMLELLNYVKYKEDQQRAKPNSQLDAQGTI